MTVYVVTYLKGDKWFVDAVYKTYELAEQRTKNLTIQSYDDNSIVRTVLFG